MTIRLLSENLARLETERKQAQEELEKVTATKLKIEKELEAARENAKENIERVRKELEEECEKYRVQAERATAALNENLESNEECAAALKEYK